jgi:hypothetical protein
MNKFPSWPFVRVLFWSTCHQHLFTLYLYITNIDSGLGSKRVRCLSEMHLNNDRVCNRPGRGKLRGPDDHIPTFSGSYGLYALK